MALVVFACSLGLGRLAENGACDAIVFKFRELFNPETVCMIFVVAAFVFVDGGRCRVCLRPQTLQLWESGSCNAISLKISDPLNPQTVCMIFVAAAFEFWGSDLGCVCLQLWTLQVLDVWFVHPPSTEV